MISLEEMEALDKARELGGIHSSNFIRACSTWVSWAIAQIKALDRDFLASVANYDTLRGAFEDQKDYVARLEGAIRWYAGDAWKASDSGVGGQQITYPIDNDYGKRAREALSED